jgi:hypothetical protein
MEKSGQSVTFQFRSTWRLRLRVYRQRLWARKVRVGVVWAFAIAATLAHWDLQRPDDRNATLAVSLLLAWGALHAIGVFDTIFLQRPPPRAITFGGGGIRTVVHGMPVSHPWQWVLEAREKPGGLELLVDDVPIRKILWLPTTGSTGAALGELRRLLREHAHYEGEQR